jgi:hypothetical protein
MIGGAPRNSAKTGAKYRHPRLRHAIRKPNNQGMKSRHLVNDNHGGADTAAIDTPRPKPVPEAESRIFRQDRIVTHMLFVRAVMATFQPNGSKFLMVNGVVFRLSAAGLTHPAR